MKRFERFVVDVLVASVLLQPLGLVSPVLAKTVGMEYSDPEHIHAPKVVDGITYEYDANGNRIVKKSGQRTQTYVNERYQQSTIGNEQSTTKYYFANGRAAQSVNDALSFLHNDHLGSTVLATD